MTPRTRFWIVGLVLLTTLVLIIVDFRTSFFENEAFVTNIIASVVTFLLTFVAVDWIVARSRHQEWSPVTIVALSDIKAAVAQPGATPPAARELYSAMAAHPGRADALAVVEGERAKLGDTLARWASFLASNSGVNHVVNDAATVTQALDTLADAAGTQSPDATSLNPKTLAAVNQYDKALAVLLDRLETATESLLTRHVPPSDDFGRIERIGSLQPAAADPGQAEKDG